MKKDLLELDTLTSEELVTLLDLADEVKQHPDTYKDYLRGRTLLMMFEKPSLRTRLSFEVGMTQLGGHAIYYDLSTSPLGKQKETVGDTAKTASRYADIIMARLFSHADIQELARNATVPVINALTDAAHPCQILADLQTIREKKQRLQGLKVCYLGDAKNNVTHSLMFGCALLGLNLAIGCPADAAYEPPLKIRTRTEQLATKSGSTLTIHHDAQEAIKDADVVYTDSWMSYHIPQTELTTRVATLTPYQVTGALMRLAKPDAIFLHCLPATRGMEMTADVIDGSQSVVFDEAENRLHAQKALMLKLLQVV